MNITKMQGKKDKKSEGQKSAYFSSLRADFEFQSQPKPSRANPRQKLFSSSYGSSQIGSDSSLIFR